MIARYMRDNFLGAVFILSIMSIIIGIIGIEVIIFYTACIHLFGMGGGVNG
jgi:hypothetical protein